MAYTSEINDIAADQQSVDSAPATSAPSIFEPQQSAPPIPSWTRDIMGDPRWSKLPDAQRQSMARNYFTKYIQPSNLPDDKKALAKTNLFKTVGINNDIPKWSTQQPTDGTKSPDSIDVNAQSDISAVQSLPNGMPTGQGMPTNVRQVAPQGLNERGMQTLVNPILKAPVETARSAALMTMPFADEEGKRQLTDFIGKTNTVIKNLNPNADSSFIDRFVGGAIGLVPYLATGGAGAVSLLANSASRGIDAIDQGIDSDTATKLAMKDLATTALMFKLPMGGQTIAGGMAKGATVNVGLDIASKAAEKGILSAADYKDLSDKVQLINSESGSSALMGAAFGARQSMGNIDWTAEAQKVANQARANIAARNAATAPPLNANEARGSLSPEHPAQPENQRVAQPQPQEIMENSVPRGISETPPPGAAVGPDQPVKTAAPSFLPLDEHQAVMSKKTVDMTPDERSYALTHDKLTGLPNQKALEESPEQPNLVLLDVDGFKQVNDRFGHSAGDEYLQAIRSVMDQNGIDWFHRLHGDEHAFYAADQGQALERLRTLDNALKDVRIEVTDNKTGESYTLDGVGYSHGIGEGNTFDEKFKSADKDLYATKDFRTDFTGQRIPGSLPAEVSLTPASEGRGPEELNRSGSVQEQAGSLPANQEVTPHPEKDLIEQAAYAMSEKKRYGADEPFMSDRPSGWTYDESADFLHKVASGETTPKSSAQKRFVESALPTMRDEQVQAAAYEKLPAAEDKPSSTGGTTEPTAGPDTAQTINPKGELNLGLTKGTDLRAPEHENKPVSMDELPLGKATNEAKDRAGALRDFKEQHLRMYPDATDADVQKAFTRRGQAVAVPSIDLTHSMKSDVQHKDQELYAFPAGLSQPIKNAIHGLGKTEVIDGLKRGFAAVTREGADKSASILSEEISKAARIQDQFEYGMDSASKAFSKSDPKSNIDFMQRMDTGQRQPTTELQAVADTIKRMFDKKVDEVQRLNPNALQSVRDNYFPHIWKHKGQIDEFIKTLSRRPFEGSKGFMKQRVFDDVQKGIDAGHEPVSNNPIDLAVLKMMEMDKYIIAHRTIQELKHTGDVKFYNASEKSDPDYHLINDKFSTVWRPIKDADGNVVGRTIAGHYYAKDATAQILNNYLSQNLYHNKYIGSLFKAYMGSANALNQFQLGVFSAFHAGFTSFETVISQTALGLKQLSEGRASDAMKSLGKAPVAWIQNPIRGDRLIKEWRQPGSQSKEMADIIDALIASGGKLNALRGERFQTNWTKGMRESWGEGGMKGKVAAIAKSPFALVEQSARPILQWLVPRQKFGVFGELMHDWMTQNPNSSHEEMRTAARQFWNRVDSRLGQVNYDRLFANNMTKNIVQALVRAPGWTGGTLVEVGGGAIDTIRFADDILSGKKPIMSDRMAYTLSLLMVTGAINGALTYAFTGEKPKDKDFWAFRTGRKDAQGKDERFMLPTYAKDILAYTEAPGTTLLHKSHPALSIGADLIKNQDYYGNQIREQDANYIKQLAQSSGYVAKQFIPFWMRGIKKADESGKSIGSIAAPFVGIMPAPRSLTQTNAEKMLYQMKRNDRPQGGYTTDQTKRFATISDLKNQYKAGDITLGDAIRSAKEEGIQLSEATVRGMIMSKKTGPAADQYQMQKLTGRRTAEEMMEVWDEMNDDEKAKYKPIVLNKVANSKTMNLKDKEDAILTITGRRRL